MREIDKIIVHCTATPAGRDHTAAEIGNWHRARGFDGIGYHYLVRTDGTVEPGREESRAGAHCRGYNARSIGVAYVGGIGSGGLPADTRTPAQRAALLRLLAALRARYPAAKIHGHRDFAAKACPCFDATLEYASL